MEVGGHEKEKGQKKEELILLIRSSKYAVNVLGPRCRLLP